MPFCRVGQAILPGGGAGNLACSRLSAGSWSFYILKLSWTDERGADTRLGALFMRICNQAAHYPACATLTGDSRNHHPDGKWFFVTWHLHGSLPHALYPPREKLTSGTAFVGMDRYLDTTRIGPMYLAQESLAGIVRSAARPRSAQRRPFSLR